MTIGIIGAGALGSNVARALAKVGISATIANSRGPESLAELVKDIGPTLTAGTLAEAAAADIVLVALRWVDAEKVLSSLPAWNGRIVIDGTNPVAFLAEGSPERNDPNNPFAAYGIAPIDLGGVPSTDIFAGFVPGARVVKAFNHLDVNVLQEPTMNGGQRVLFYSGNDAKAKAEVGAIIEKMGFFAVDVGSQAVGGALAQLPFGALAMTNFVKV
ncbi:MAG: NADP oxidoreductase [Rhodobacteraceae bacterium PARR1]|nr:MAG: NADP oxidoreductase [Rhodobacteraceae bacterium PARR1]